MSAENPARASRQAYMALLAIVIGVGVAYLTLPIAVMVFFLPVAFPGAIIALAVGYVYSEEAKKRSKMERGEGVIARWRLNAAHWREFVRLNKDVIVIPRITAAQRFGPPAPAGAEPEVGTGVEVIFAEDAVYVDGDFYTMDRTWGTTATLHHPSHIELAQGGLDSYCPICVPIPAGYDADAERVARHFSADAGTG